MMKLPRFMIAATASGSGKTLITCGILQALVNRGLKVASFKTGPDYIDPMFHSKVIGAKSRNLDTFFTDEATTRYLFGKTASQADISVMEGVMGFYDGLAGKSTKASAYDLSKVTDTPVILIINCKGMSLSILPMILGFCKYREDSKVEGVILNNLSKSIYPEIKSAVEEELGIHVYGYVPNVKDCVIESRHLGLVTPDEIEDLHTNLNKLAEVLEESLELDNLLALANAASELEYTAPEFKKLPCLEDSNKKKPLIAVARDKSFCFYYEDNLELLREMGAEIVEFSPITDEKLPEGIDGLILGGGYPELVAKELSENTSMLSSIKNAIEAGLPTLAECGGFMYLHDSMEDMNGVSYPVVGAIEGRSYKTEHLNRFGYIELTSLTDNILADKDVKIRGHEFHYFDSTACGDGFRANKPLRKKNWECINVGEKGSRFENLAAGYPHLYYYSNPDVAYNFLVRASEYNK